MPIRGRSFVMDGFLSLRWRQRSPFVDRPGPAIPRLNIECADLNRPNKTVAIARHSDPYPSGLPLSRNLRDLPGPGGGGTPRRDVDGRQNPDFLFRSV